MKKLSKVLSIVVIALMLSVVASNLVLASNLIDPGTIKGKPGAGAASVTDLGQQIVGIIQVVGSIAAVAVLIVLGIKYMMGSTEEKAEYKKTLIPYLVGAVLIFAASNIASIVYKWAITIK